MSHVNEQLRGAAKGGDEAQVKALLLDPKCDPLAKDLWGLTALMYAALEGYDSCVSFILPVSDPLAKDRSGMTALMWAACNKDASCVELLLPVSEVLTKDQSGCNALMIAAYKGSTSCVQVLLPVSDILAKSNDGKTAGELAKESGYDTLARYIDACVFVQDEKLALSSILSTEASQKSSSLRL